MEINNLPKRKEVKQYYHPPRSESLPEAELYQEIAQNGFRGEKQYKIAGYYVDIAFPESKVVVEYDGEEYHQDLQKDVEREIVIKNAGFDIIRVGKNGGMYVITYIGKEVKELGYTLKYEDAIFQTAEWTAKLLRMRQEYLHPEIVDSEIGDDAELKDIKGDLAGSYERIVSRYIRAGKEAENITP